MASLFTAWNDASTHGTDVHECRDGEIVWAEEGFGSGGLVATEDHVIVFDLGKLTIFPATSEGFKPLVQQQVMEGNAGPHPFLPTGESSVAMRRAKSPRLSQAVK